MGSVACGGRGEGVMFCCVDPSVLGGFMCGVCRCHFLVVSTLSVSKKLVCGWLNFVMGASGLKGRVEEGDFRPTMAAAWRSNQKFKALNVGCVV